MKSFFGKIGKHAGVASLLGGVFLFSTVELASKRLQDLDVQVDADVLVFLRFFITGIVLISLGYPGFRREGKKIVARDLGLFAMNGVVGVTLAIYLFHIAINMFTNASSSAVVFSVNPVFVMILARFINGEKWTARKWVSASVASVGVMLFAMESGNFDMKSLASVGVMSASACLFALSTCIAKRVMSRYGAMMFVGFSSLFGSLFLVPIIAFRFTPDMSAEIMKGIWIILYLSLVGTALGYALYFYGVMRTSAQGGSMSFFLKPVLASVLSVLIRPEETISMPMALGTTFILCGLFLAVLLPMVLKRRKETT